jgi:hypothetical protein
VVGWVIGRAPAWATTGFGIGRCTEQGHRGYRTDNRCAHRTLLCPVMARNEGWPTPQSTVSEVFALG